jgi:AbrB family looped-hinge helix DNA binding protein
MPAATLTSKGQITLPKPIRDLLKLHTGDAVDFVVDDRGEVRVRAGRVDVRDLRGSLHRAGRKPVSLAAMDRAIREARARRP